MTITGTTNKVNYNGNGVQTEFDTTYRFLSNSDLSVYVDGVLKTIVTDYTVSGAGDDSGGTVTFLAAPSSSEIITIKNAPTITQETDYVENDPFPAESHENALDKLTIISQSINERVDRSISFDIDSTSTAILPEPESDKVIGWNADGDNLENKEITGSGTILIPVPIYQGGTGAITEGEALANLGAGSAATKNTGTDPGEIPTVDELGEGAFVDAADQATAEAGTDNVDYMTALRVAQAILAQAFSGEVSQISTRTAASGTGTWTFSTEVGKLVTVSYSNTVAATSIFAYGVTSGSDTTFPVSSGNVSYCGQSGSGDGMSSSFSFRANATSVTITLIAVSGAGSLTALQ